MHLNTRITVVWFTEELLIFTKDASRTQNDCENGEMRMMEFD